MIQKLKLNIYIVASVVKICPMSEIKNNGQDNGSVHCRNLSYLNSRIENSIDQSVIKWDKFLLKNLKLEYYIII